MSRRIFADEVHRLIEDRCGQEVTGVKRGRIVGGHGGRKVKILTVNGHGVLFKINAPDGKQEITVRSTNPQTTAQEIGKLLRSRRDTDVSFEL